jgi:hypothetical protein
MKGSWIGAWDGNTAHGPDVILVMNWDGKTVSGMINPGTDNIAISRATLDPAGWKVHIEADTKDKAGAAVKYTVDGAIGQLEMANRTITGTWTNGKAKGKFEVRRQ